MPASYGSHQTWALLEVGLAVGVQAPNALGTSWAPSGKDIVGTQAREDAW